MKAIELQHPGGIDNLRLVERPMPEPGRQEMIIRVRATALNYRDVEIARGIYHTAFALRWCRFRMASAKWLRLAPK